ncbi:MAG: hypothetical protein K9K88_15910, partial [Desulfobacterales bacterium]|nr:hypothetical protein [Desulfobacterales bacterium]
PTFAVSGGADAGRFSIDANTGVLTFNSAPDFEAPADADANNIYEVQVTASDGNGGSDTQTISVAVTNVNDAPTATHMNTPETYAEGTSLDLTDIVVADVDNANLTVTLTLSDPAAGTLSTGTSGAVTSTFAGGVWTASGAVGDINALLAAVVFTPSTGYSGGFTIAVSVDDGAAPAVTGVKAVTLASAAAPTPPTLPVDDNPVDPEEIVPPEPEPPVEEPEPAVEEEAAAEEDSLSDADSGDTVAGAVPAASGQGSSKQGFFSSTRRESEAAAARNFRYDGGADAELTDIQGAPAATQPAWYQPTPKLTISDPNFQRNAFEILTARAFEFLENSLDSLKEETAGDIEYNQAVLSTSIAVATGLSMGYVAWLLRSGILLSSLLSSMPAWRFLDPLPILAGRRDDSDEEDEESLESIIEKGAPPKDPKNEKKLPSAEALS